MTASGETLLRLEQVEKIYDGSGSPVVALAGIDLSVREADFLALMGPSGCGKTTLLHIAGAMDRPTAGRVVLEGLDLAGLPDDALAALRRRKLGFVFQYFNLLPTLTALENVALPLLLDGEPRGRAERRARELLETVGLPAKAPRSPRELSGGEMQRVAIARAVAANPRLLLADEPTGSLDTANGKVVLDLLGRLNRELSLTVILATHSEEVAASARRRILLRDGRIERVIAR